ncbi:MAG: hypothetical protein ABWZ43_09210 [Solirubrobacterales bacterium]
MAATATARSSAAARRATAKRRASAAPARGRASQGQITGFVPVAAAAGAVGGLADSRIFVWLSRGRLWIGLLGALLVGIVGLNVMALSFSASSSDAGQAADALRRQNSAFRAQIAGQLSNSEIQAVAAELGLIMPGPGSFTYVESTPGDAARAAERLRNGEIVVGTGSLGVAETVVAPVVPVDPAATTTPAAETETAAPPTETTAPSAETAAPPVETAAPPVETAAPPATAGSGAGSVAAP